MIEKVLAERGSRYGTFADHAQIAQSLIETLRSQPNWLKLKPDARQALTVICDKIARMLNGDPEYDDNWTDIIGYATLVLNRIHADQRDEADRVANHTLDAARYTVDEEPYELTDEYQEKQAANEGMTLGKQHLFEDTAPCSTDPAG